MIISHFRVRKTQTPYLQPFRFSLMFSLPLSETFLLSLLDQQQAGILYYEPIFDSSGTQQDPVDFKVLYCNQKAAYNTGVPIQELTGCRALSFPNVDNAAREKLFQQILVVYQSGKSLEGTIFNSLLNRNYRIIRSKVGNGVLAEVKDITQEVQERVEKERQTQFVNLVLETSLNGWFSCATVRDQKCNITDFIITRVNPEFTRMVDLPTADVIGKSYLTLFPSAKANGTFDLNCRVVETGKSERHQMHYLGDGLDAWYDIVVSRLEPDAFLVTFEDITQYKQAVAELTKKNTLLDNILLHSANGISVTQIIRNDQGKVVDGRTILAIEAAIAHTGLPKEIYLSKTAVELEPNITQSPYFQMCVGTLETGVPSQAQYQVESTGRWLEISISRLDENHLITIFTDITSAKEAQLALEHSVEDLKRSNQSLEDFAYAASHDLKEPLRKIRTFCSKLKDNLIPHTSESDARLFDRIDTAAERMQLLVDDLLEFSHISGGAKDLEVVDLGEKVQKVLGDLELLIEEKGATIIVGALPTIKGNRRQLQQLFHNLISNALKYSKTDMLPEIRITSRKIKGADVAVRLPLEEQSRDFHLIEVSDNGIGFEQQYAGRIFEMFQRLHGKNEYGGTGVGLSIARKVVENHHGHIFATGALGKGATFHILLPV